jgi:transcriptional regulator with XRE-family HTH domain
VSHRLNIQKLREVAAEVGDHTAYRIAKRTGLSQSTISRLVNNETQPNAATQGRILDAYTELDIRQLMTVADDTNQVAA